MPSPCAAPTSAPCLSSVRTPSRSPRIAASATGVADGAAASQAVASSAADTVTPNKRFISSSSSVAQPFSSVPLSVKKGSYPFFSAEKGVRPLFLRHGRRRRRRERELAGAVAECLHVVDAERVQQREHHVRHRRAVGGLQVHV